MNRIYFFSCSFFFHRQIKIVHNDLLRVKCNLFFLFLTSFVGCWSVHQSNRHTESNLCNNQHSVRDLASVGKEGAKKKKKNRERGVTKYILEGKRLA